VNLIHGDLIYLDNNATTPVDPRVLEAVVAALERGWGNPSSGHRLGRVAREFVETARGQVAACLGARADEILFTSGGTEADNWALAGTVSARGGGHIVTTAVEHPAVLATARMLERTGRARITVVGVDRDGLVDVEDVVRALERDTALVSVMLANNEVGTLQNVAGIAAACRARGVLLHTDAAQAIGKIAVDVGALGVDLLTVAGHKLYAPKGVGALFVRRGVAIEPLIRGAAHERGLRAGTENAPGIVGLGAACEITTQELASDGARLAALRDRLEAALAAGVPDLVFHGHRQLRLPNTASIAFPGTDANALLEALAEDVAASPGAACHTGAVHPSSVLTAMGVDAATALATVRFSLGRFTTPRDVEEGARRVIAAVRALPSGAQREQDPRA
jgi:cysteine desulfurase